MTFCPPCGIILEQSARTAEKQKVNIAGWSSLVARRAHNPKVVGSNPAPATTKQGEFCKFSLFFCSHLIPKGIPEHPQMFRYPFYAVIQVLSPAVLESFLRLDHIEGLFKLGRIRQQTLQGSGIAAYLHLTGLLPLHQGKELQPLAGDGGLRVRAVLS